MEGVKSNLEMQNERGTRAREFGGLQERWKGAIPERKDLGQVLGAETTGAPEGQLQKEDDEEASRTRKV